MLKDNDRPLCIFIARARFPSYIGGTEASVKSRGADRSVGMHGLESEDACAS